MALHDSIEVTYLIGPGVTATETVKVTHKGGAVKFLPAGHALQDDKTETVLVSAPAGLHYVLELDRAREVVQKFVISSVAFVAAIERPKR